MIVSLAVTENLSRASWIRRMFEEGTRLDALAELGVEHIEMPATSERVWRAIRAAARGETT